MTNPTPYSWTFLRFFRGFCDWLREQHVAENRREGGSVPPSPGQVRIGPLLFGSTALLLLGCAATVLLAPLLAQASGAAAGAILFYGAMAGGVALTVWAAKLLVKGSVRVVRFVDAMGRRGWEIECGVRVPTRVVV